MYAKSRTFDEFPKENFANFHLEIGEGGSIRTTIQYNRIVYTEGKTNEIYDNLFTPCQFNA